MGKQIKISWEKNPEADVAGYKLYTRTTGTTYGDGIDVGNVLEYTFTPPDLTKDYFFAVTCYDTSGNESLFSDEVKADIVAPGKPAKPWVKVIMAVASFFVVYAGL